MEIKGAMVQWTNIQRHHESREHNRHVLAYYNEFPAAGPDAPSGLEALLRAMMSGRAFLTTRLQRTQLWSVFEALRDSERKFLDTATSVALHQDERKGLLTARYVACDANLTVRRGVLHATRLEGGTGSAELALALERGIERFAAERRNMAGTNKRRLVPPAADDAFVRRLCRKIEVYTADAAADEQLAGRLFMPTSGRSLPGMQTMPRLKFVARDKAHASRRPESQSVTSIDTRLA